MKGVDEGFFEKHSEKYLKMAFNKDRAEKIENPDGYGSKTGVCGDTISMYISTRKDKLDFVSYNVDGCVNTNACAATLSMLTEGKTLEQAWEITPEDISGYLETLPEHEMHCAELAVGAFFLALSDAQKK